MTIPTTAFGVFALVALLVPGIVHASVRITLQGFRAPDRSIGERLLQAVLVSVALDALYLITLGNWLGGMVKLGEHVLVKEPTEVGWALLLLGIVVPLFLGYLQHGNAPVVRVMVSWLREKTAEWVVPFAPVSGYSEVPTAWDWIATRNGGKWIRILTADDTWVGGWFSDDSFVSLHPEPRDIYLAIQWLMSPEGNFIEPAPNGSGVWLPLDSAKLVEWTDRVPEEKEIHDD
jgi:hypothetical protein